MCVCVGETTVMTTDEAALLLEANRLNYRLRSAFFYRKLKEYHTLAFPLMIAELLPIEHLYDWSNRNNWGIGEDAFSYIQGHPDLRLIQVFCHPKLLREYPTLVAYYRNIASLSQKSVGYLESIDIKSLKTAGRIATFLQKFKPLAWPACSIYIFRSSLIVLSKVLLKKNFMD